MTEGHYGVYRIEKSKNNGQGSFTEKWNRELWGAKL